MTDYNASRDRFWNFADICHRAGLHDYFDCLLRTLQTRAALADKNISSPEEVYRTMQKATSELPRFQGDADLFFQIYNSLCDIDAHDVMDFVSIFNNNRGEMAVPDVLVDKFSEYISDTTRTIFIAECQQYSTGLLSMIEAHPDIKFTLCTRSLVWSTILNFVYNSYQNVNLITADIYTENFINNRFDLIFAVPVFGMRTPYAEQDFICKDSDMIAVQNLLYHIELDGQLIIVLPAKVTFGSGSIAALRHYIESNYSVEEISALPAGLFAPYTSIRTYLFVLSTGRTDDVVLRQYESEKPIRKTSPCKNLVVKNEILLFSDEFADLNGWNIDMVFSEEDEDIKAFSTSPVKKLRLKDVATVFRGKAVNAKAESGNVAVINISNITDTGIDYENLDQIEEEERKVSRYILEDGDVLVTARGTTIKIAAFEKQSMICIPSANINVIRPKDMLRGVYLKLFLESPVGIKMLQSLQRGTVVVNINYKDIIELEVPVLPLEAQDTLIEEYNTGLRFYKETIAAAEEGWRGVQQEIQSKLF